MPNENNFYPQEKMKTSTRPDVKSIRCMKDCKKGKKFKEIEVLKGITPLEPLLRKNETLEIKQKASKGKNFKFKVLYKNKCSICHTSGIDEAPIVGDKSVWKSIIKSNKSIIYNNVIQGKDSMSPKGGDTYIIDDDIKGIVDYMISISQ